MVFAHSLHTLLSMPNLDGKDSKTVDCHTTLQGKPMQEAYTWSVHRQQPSQILSLSLLPVGFHVFLTFVTGVLPGGGGACF